jgi:phenylalanyl-tRNA synthetase alpha chain
MKSPTTKLLYLDDAYLKQVKAKIVDIRNGNLILNQTIFYPEGGGQPSDTGTITGSNGTLKVAQVSYNNGAPLHQGKSTGSFQIKDEVELTLDWDRRYYNMRQHSAGHIVHEAVVEVMPEIPVLEGKHGIGKEYYIKYQGIIDQIIFDDIQSAVDRIVGANEPITTKFIARDELEQLDIPIPTDLPTNKPLRIMQIGSRSPMPDGGTQVKTTSETGAITISDIEYDEGSSKVHYQITILPQTEVQKPIIAINPDSATLSLSNFKNQLSLFNKSLSTGLTETAINKQLKELTSQIPKLPVDDRKVAGQLLNQTKTKIANTISKSGTKSQDLEESEWLDVTAPGIKPPIGHPHLITEAISEIEAIFSRLGFVRRRYPEIETDWYYAEGLNIPKDHPARDDQETFYFSENVVLTAHTSNGQLREMELMGKPPIKMINIGKTYRRQASNTHSPMFHQFEGLLIDHGINMTHLVGVSNYFAKNYFGPDREIRLRPHHFQFTEPSFEVDINCHICKGTGKVNGKKCKVCKSGWLELGGAGMVHPNVLKNGHIDPDKYSGFAFGWGVERVIMMKHQVTDNLRELYSTDLRFLKQS